MLQHSVKVCFFIGAVACIADAGASGLQLESEVNAQVSYADNINLSSIADEASSIVLVTPKVKLTHENDDWETTANAHVSGTTYSAQLQNKLESYIDFGTAYKEDRGVYSISASYDIHANRAEETNILGDAIEQVDTRTFSVKPNYEYLLSERTSLSIAVDLSSVDYTSDSTGVSGEFFSYDTLEALGVINYKLSQKSELSLILSSMDYASDNGASEYQVLSSKIGIDHNFSKMISAKLFAGVNDRTFSDTSSQSFPFFGSIVTGVQELETSSSGTSFDASFNAGWVTLDASRNYISNSLGGLNRTESVNAKFRMQVTSLIGLTLMVGHDKVNEINEYVLPNSQSYTTATPAVKISLAHNLTVRGKYTRVEKEIISSTRNDLIKYNRYYVEMTYSFPSI